MKQLNSAERSALRARAHPLKPVVIIGAGGLTPGVLLEIERSLKAHELIKIRVGEADHAGRETICETICAHAGAAPVQHIGKILVIYRENPEPEAKPAYAKTRQRPAPAKERPARKSSGRPTTSGKAGAGARSGGSRTSREQRRARSQGGTRAR